ncbi:MAG: 3-oxoacyl-[acyl-carrier-protein] reductase [Clostridiales bacterium]|nr:3-oxoacyl-[acyl-carrier-protein] reductase [Clostridiales bacterium]
MELDGKTALVTGSARGLGRAIAWQLASMGASVVLNDIEASDSIDATAEEFAAQGFRVAVAKGDVRSPDDAKRICKTAVDAFGSLDILVNNAGITRDKPMAMMSEADWDDVLDINLKGSFLCLKAASRYMIRQRGGTIVNVASVAGVMGNPGQANYSASKAGLIGLTKSAAKELAPRNITCNAVAPGVIISKMTDALPDKVKENYMSSIPLSRFGTPEDVAGVIGFLASGAAGYVTGQVLHIDGGLVM